MLLQPGQARLCLAEPGWELSFPETLKLLFPESSSVQISRCLCWSPGPLPRITVNTWRGAASWHPPRAGGAQVTSQWHLAVHTQQKLLTANSPGRANTASICIPETAPVFWFSHLSYQGGVKGLTGGCCSHTCEFQVQTATSVKIKSAGARCETCESPQQKLMYDQGSVQA